MATRTSLSRTRIFQEALRLVDEEGIDALTMRRLAGQLGVGTMSLYNHVPNKDDLLDGLVGTVLAEMAPPPSAPAGWREALGFMATEFRRIGVLHPHAVPLMTDRRPGSQEGLRLVEAIFDALARAGMDRQAAATAYRLTTSYVLGFVILESGGFFRSSGPAAARRTRDNDDFPRVVEAVPYLLDFDSDAEFAAGLDAMLDFIARHPAIAGRRAG